MLQQNDHMSVRRHYIIAITTFTNGVIKNKKTKLSNFIQERLYMKLKK